MHIQVKKGTGSIRMKDSFGREIEYMRVSVTDRCSLRCRYCMPEGIKLTDRNEILSFEEIVRVCECAAKLGINTVRVTGGEPLARRDCPKLISMIKGISGIEKVTMTTNGVLLREHLDELVLAGIDGINISLDTLKAERYEYITGSDCLFRVTGAVEACLDAGISLKINSVIIKGVNDDEIADLASLAKENPLDVRFIEMMPIGSGRDYPPLRGEDVRRKVEEEFGKGKIDGSLHGKGPARYYRHDGFKGSIGYIDAVNNSFCSSCNRVRLTSDGKLKSCLCYDEGADLKAALRTEGICREKVTDLIREAVLSKPLMHCFDETEKITEKKRMVSIGG